MFDYSTVDKSVYIQKRYPVTDEEFDYLVQKYGKLCWFAATKLGNQKHRLPEDLSDFHSEIQLGMCRAGSYFKRQTFLEKCFTHLEQSDLSSEDKSILEEIQKIWNTKKALFGEKEEDRLLELFNKYRDNVDFSDHDRLIFNEKFEVYCKSIIWNTTKTLGEHISRENSLRASEISLDEYPFIAGNIEDGNPITRPFDMVSLRKRIAQHKDERVVQTFDIITDPENEKQVFKTDDRVNMKINIVRKKTKMSYRTINNILDMIKKTIQEEMSQ